MDCELFIKVWIGEESLLDNEPLHGSECGLTPVVPFDIALFRTSSQFCEWCTYLTVSRPKIAVVLNHAQEMTYLCFCGRTLHIKYGLNLLRLGFYPFLGYNVAEIFYLRLTEYTLVFLHLSPAFASRFMTISSSLRCSSYAPRMTTSKSAI